VSQKLGSAYHLAWSPATPEEGPHPESACAIAQQARVACHAYTTVDSIATCVTPSSASQSAGHRMCSACFPEGEVGIADLGRAARTYGFLANQLADDECHVPERVLQSER